MTQSLWIPASNALQKDPLSFRPQPRELAAPSRTGPGGGAAAPVKPKAAYAPFSLGFRDAQPKKPHPQAPVTLEVSVLTIRPPEKNTFIHFDVPDSRVSSLTKEQIERWGSAPCILQTAPYQTKFPQMETAHVRNECKPCAYHFQKVDGCRWGDQCTFCHLCPTGEIKRRKKEKVRAIKVQGSRSKQGEPRVLASKNC